MIKQATYESEILWQEFSDKYKLTETQLKQFQKYYKFLIIHNSYYNLTTVTDLKAVIHNHFEDSLALGQLLDMTKVESIADVGTGGGFPSIPLKIVYPHLHAILIEVVHKKIQFLEIVINALKLSSIEISSYDWRTFLRKTSYNIQIFCARASLQPEEVLRIFKPSSIYKNSKFVYWASKTWLPNNKEISFISEQLEYNVGNKKRKLVLFKNQA